MTDEEKKAIEKIEMLMEYLKKWNKNFTVVPEDAKYFEKILDMTKTHIRMIDENIEELLQQSKEIEELKEKNEFLNWYFENQKENFIHKDKIKEMLEIKEDIDNEKILSLLQTIVDENARLEDIEDRKVQIEYNNVFNKGVKSVEDKIKAKIEELENQKEKYFEKQVIQHEIEILQSLLEKE